MDSADAIAGAGVGLFVGFVVFVDFVGFKMNMSSSLGVAAALVAAALVAACVEGGLEAIEAQDFIECNKYWVTSIGTL